MNYRIGVTSLLLAVAFTSLSFGQGMPNHVKKSLDKLIGTWQMQTSAEDQELDTVVIEWAVKDTALKFTWVGTDLKTNEPGSSIGMIGWHPTKKLLVEYEIGTQGFTSEGTHQISEDGKWVSQIRGTAANEDGTPVYYEYHRVITFQSKDAWSVTIEGIMDGETVRSPQGEQVSTFRRK